MRITLFPGTFDPPTLGHFDLMQRAASLCDQLIVAIGSHPTKQPIATIEERVSLLHLLTKKIPKITVASFQGLTIDLPINAKPMFSSDLCGHFLILNTSHK